MGKKLYIECNTGISGDMTVASLLDLGADREVLQKALYSLKEKVGGFDVKISQVTKAGIVAADFDVILDEDNHDHNMDYLYGHEHSGHHEHHHEHHHHDDTEHHEHHHHDDVEHHEHEHHHHDDTEHHEHHHEHHHHNDAEHHEHHHDHHHVHRSLPDVIDIINAADITESARALAVKVFTIVAEAEAAVHGRSIEEVHFHEVGAIDSIVDIIAAAVCYDDIVSKNDIDETIVTRLVDGTGTVRCQHGILSIPVPAVLKIAEQRRVPLSISNRKGEYVTPTGAAFAAAVMDTSSLPDSFIIERTGVGAGKRDYDIPGMVRTMILN